MSNNDDKYNSETDPDLEELRTAWIALQQSRQSKKPTNLSEVNNLNEGLEALHEDQKENPPKVNRPKALNPNTIKIGRIGNHQIPMKKRGFFGRLCRKIYKNYMYGCSKSVNPMGYDYESMLKNGDLEFEDMLHVQLYQDMISSPEYKQQQMLDQMAANNEALAERIISQGMTWLVPRFEDKLDEISQKIKKDW